MKKNERYNQKKKPICSIWEVKTAYLISIFIILGWISLITSFIIGKSRTGYILIPVSFLFFGLSGLTMATRKEVPQFNIYGIWAVIYGITLMILGLGISIILFYAMVMKWFFH
jgi:uncharacterized membrane protein